MQAQISIPASRVDAVADLVSMVISETTAPGNLTVSSNQASKNYELTVTGLKEGSDVVIGTMFIGKGLTGVQLFHRGTEQFSDSGVSGVDDVDAHAEFFYDSNSGYITFATTSFSPFSALFDMPAGISGEGTMNETYYATADEAQNAANNGTEVSAYRDVVAGEAGNSDEIAIGKGELFEVPVCALQHDGKTVGYATLDAAIAAAADGDTVKLNQDYLITDHVYVEKSITLDLGGHTLSTAGDYLTFGQTNLGTLVAVSATIQNGTFVGIASGNYGNGYIGFTKDCSGTFNRVTFRGTTGLGQAGCVLKVYANDDGTAVNKYTFNECVFDNVYVEFNGASGSTDNFEVTLDGCTLTANTLPNSTGILKFDSYTFGELNIRNSSFTISSAELSGYGVYFGTYPYYTAGKNIAANFDNVIFNTTQNARPYYMGNVHYYVSAIGEYRDSAVVTPVDTTYTINGEDMAAVFISNKLTWMSAARYNATDAAKAEWDLFRTTSGSGFSSGNYYVVQCEGINFVTRNTNFYSEDRSVAPYKDGFICYTTQNDYGTLYKQIVGEDLSASLTGQNDDVKIFKLENASKVELSNGITSEVVDVVARNEEFTYQLPESYASKNYKAVNLTGGTVSESGLVSIPAASMTGNVTITCYDAYQIYLEGAYGGSIYTTGSAGSKFPYYNTEASALKVQVNLNGVNAAYKISSVTVGGVELDSSLYTVTPTQNGGSWNGKSFDVAFNKAALTGDIYITVLESPLYTEYKAVYNTLGDSKDTYSYLITDGTDYMLGYIGRVAEPSKVAVDGDKAYLYERYTADNRKLTLTVPYTYEIGTEDISASVAGCSDEIKVYKLTNIYTVMVKQGQTVLDSSTTVKSGETYTFTIPEGKTLNTVSMGGAGGWSLTKDTHYTVEGNTVKIDTSTFDSNPKIADSYSINISIK